jgi:hypothetical protein
MITEITAAQKALMPVYVAKYVALGLDTSPTDRPRAIQAMRELADLSSRKAEKYIEMIVDDNDPSSIAAYHACEPANGEIAIIAGKHSTIKRLIAESGGDASSALVYAQHSAATPAFYKFMVDVMGVTNFTKPEDLVTERTEALHNFSAYCGLVFDFENALFVCDKPVAHNLRDDGKYDVVFK